MAGTLGFSAVMLFSNLWKRTRASLTLLLPKTVVFFRTAEWILLVLRAPADCSVLPPMKSWSRFWSSSE